MFEDSKSRARRSRKNKKAHKNHKIPEVVHGNLSKDVVKNDLSVNVFAPHANSILERQPKQPLLINKKLKDLDLEVKDKIFMADSDQMPGLTPAGDYSDSGEIDPKLSVIEISSETDDKNPTETTEAIEAVVPVVPENKGVFSYITSFFW
jgi:hypothetical protein